MRAQDSKVLESMTSDHAAFVEVFKGDSGKRVVEHLRHRFFVDRPTFNKDPYLAAYNEGMRTAALHIISMADKEKFGQYLESVKLKMEKLED